TSELRGLLRRRRSAFPTQADSATRRVVLTPADSLALVDSLGLRPAVDSLGRLVVAPRRATRPVRAVGLDTGQTIFGLNTFAAATTQFDANVSGPVDASYRLGPGDRLVLLITGDAERAHTLDVTREGFVVVPG